MSSEQLKQEIEKLARLTLCCANEFQLYALRAKIEILKQIEQRYY